MITVLVISILVLVAIAGLLYFFKPKAKPINGEKKPKGKKLEIPQFVKDWWEKKDDEGKRWSLYTAIAIVSITVSYAIGGNDGYAAAAIIALVSLHFVWLAYSEKSSLFTKTFITGFLLYYIAAWMVPDVVKIRDASWSMTKKAVAEVAVNAEYADKNYGKPPVAIQATTEVTSPSGISTVPLVVPVGITVEVDRPNGHYLASVNCPKEVVMEVTDVNTGQLVKQQDCSETVSGGNLPLNIKLAFFQKGDDGGPVDVLVRWKKIS